MTVKSALSPCISLLFLPSVKALESKVFLKSKNLTISPTAGLPGKVTVKPPPLVSQNNCCPDCAEYVVVTVTPFKTPTGNQAVPLYNSKFVNSVLNLSAPAPASAVLCAVVPKGTVKPGEPTDNLLPLALSYPYVMPPVRLFQYP